MTSIIDMRVLDLRFPTSRHPRRFRRDEPGPGLFGGLCHPGDRHAGHRRSRPDLHHRPRQRDLLRGDRGDAAPGRRAGPRLDRARHGRASGAMSPATASCAGSGPTRARSTWPPARWSTPSGTCWAKKAGKPVWQLVADMTPEELVSMHRLPLPHRLRSRPTRRSPSCASRAPARPSASPRSSARATPATPPRPAGSATRTRSCAACAARRWMPASTTSR